MFNDSTDQHYKLCLNKIVDLLSRRDHSEKELYQKLTKKGYSKRPIELAIQWAQQMGYIKPPPIQSKNITEALIRKGKGRLYIQKYLKLRGLPPTSTEDFDHDTEVQKALELAHKKMKKNKALDRKAKEKIGRHLLSRGFPQEIVRKIIYDLLKTDENEI